jgi:galactonate dehydratase
VSFAPRNPQGPLATAICVHADATIPSFTIQELFQTYDIDWVEDLLMEPITVKDGYIEIPDGPGLGVELDMNIVHEHEYTGNEDQVHTINLFEKGWKTRSLVDE